MQIVGRVMASNTLFDHFIVPDSLCGFPCVKSRFLNRPTFAAVCAFVCDSRLSAAPRCSFSLASWLTFYGSLFGCCSALWPETKLMGVPVQRAVVGAGDGENPEV